VDVGFFFVNNNVVFEVDLKLVITLAQIKVDISEFDCRLMLSINQDTIEKYKSHVLRKWHIAKIKSFYVF
jgi:hypothetical protein